MSYILPEAKTSKKKRVLSQANLDRLAEKVNSLRKARTEVAEVQVYINTLEKEIKAILGDNEEGTINGVPVVRYQKTTRVAWAQFAEDNPGLAKEFATEKTVTALDTNALLASKHKGLIEPYFVRNFTLV